MQVQFIIYFLFVSSGFHFHTHAFRSLLRVFYALRKVHVTPVTLHRHAPHHGYNAVAGKCGPLQPSIAPESAFASDKIGRKCGKVEILWVHTYPTNPSSPRGRRVQSLVQIGSEMRICISSMQTNKQTFIVIYKMLHVWARGSVLYPKRWMFGQKFYFLLSDLEHVWSQILVFIISHILQLSSIDIYSEVFFFTFLPNTDYSTDISRNCFCRSCD
jgi:hypothetical protein